RSRSATVWGGTRVRWGTIRSAAGSPSARRHACTCIPIGSGSRGITPRRALATAGPGSAAGPAGQKPHAVLGQGEVLAGDGLGLGGALLQDGLQAVLVVAQLVVALAD